MCHRMKKWCGRKPNVKHFRAFACVAYALMPDHEKNQDVSKIRQNAFCHKGGYRLYDQKRNRIVVRRDVVFNEADFDSKQHVERSVDATVDPVGSVVDSSVLPDESHHTDSAEIQQPVGTTSATSKPTSTTPHLRRSQR